MKIAITGYKSGVGKAVYDHFSNKMEVIGFDKDNGDITNPEPIVTKVIHEEVDIFFNNAYDNNHRHAQLDLLYALVEGEYEGHIITTGSNSGDGNKNQVRLYPVTKHALEKANDQLFYIGHNVTLLKPGLLNTPRVNTKERYKDRPMMSPTWVPPVIEFIINAPFRVKDISFSPKGK